jgi:hypothetical protein
MPDTMIAHVMKYQHYLSGSLRADGSQEMAGFGVSTKLMAGLGFPPRIKSFFTTVMTELADGLQTRMLTHPQGRW